METDSTHTFAFETTLGVNGITYVKRINRLQYGRICKELEAGDFLYLVLVSRLELDNTLCTIRSVIVNDAGISLKVTTLEDIQEVVSEEDQTITIQPENIEAATSYTINDKLRTIIAHRMNAYLRVRGYPPNTRSTSLATIPLRYHSITQAPEIAASSPISSGGSISSASTEELDGKKKLKSKRKRKSKSKGKRKSKKKRKSKIKSIRRR